LLNAKHDTDEEELLNQTFFLKVQQTFIGLKNTEYPVNP